MIDIKAIRNYMRVKLINAAIIPNNQWAFEGMCFDPATAPYDAYIAEVVQMDNDDKPATTVDGSQVTFTYNIWTRSPGSTETNNSYTLTNAVGSVFRDMHPTEVSTGVKLTIQSIRRRVATEEDGWRLSPIDITVRIEKYS